MSYLLYIFGVVWMIMEKVVKHMKTQLSLKFMPFFTFFKAAQIASPDWSL